MVFKTLACKLVVVVLMSIGFAYLISGLAGFSYLALALVVIVPGVLGCKVLFSEWR